MGLFLVECVFMLLCAKIVYMLLALYSDKKSALLGMQIFMMIALKRSIFEGGNLTEEYSLLFQVLSIYLLCRDKNRYSYLLMLLQGILASIVLCLRPNMIMMWGGIAIIACADMLRRGQFRRLAGNIASGLAGMAAGLAPAVAYVVLNDSVSDTLFGMFDYNFLYVKGNGFRVLSFLKNVAYCVMRGDGILVAALTVSALIMLMKVRRNFAAPYYLLMLALSVISVSLSGRNYGHYYEYLVPFCLPAVCELAVMISSQGKQKYAVIVACVLSVLLGTLELKIMRPEPLTKFAELNKPYHSKQEKVLITGIASARLYNLMGVTPQTKYFYTPATSYELFPDAMDAQAESIISLENDVVVLKYDGNIYPEVKRQEEVRQVLEKEYKLLYYDEDSELAMYGKK